MRLWSVAPRIGMYLETGALTPEPTLEERIEAARTHARLQVQVQGEFIGCKELRGLLGHYFKGVHGAPRIRQALVQVTTLAEVEALLDDARLRYAEHQNDNTTETDALESVGGR
ncbi:MAG: hypothetical protein V4671_09235 [Armatimonadota bacterium]